MRRALFLFLALSFPVFLSAQTKHTIKAGKGIPKVAHVTARVTVASVTDGAVALEASIDGFGIALQGFADGLDMFVAVPLEAMPKPIRYVGRGIHKVYLGLDFVGQKLAQ